MHLARPVGFGATVLGVLSMAGIAAAQEYYVANAGDNNNTGATPDDPIADLSPVGRGGAVTVRFKAGDSWDLSGLSVGDGAVYMAYGEGSRPTLNVIGGDGGFGGGVMLTGGGTLEGIRVTTPKGSGITQGIGISGANNVVRNCEVDGSSGEFQLGFGIMGTDSLITGNVVHDLSGMTGDSGDMNTSGGAEAYMVMGSGNEISYNSAINCWGPNETLGGAEGGCLEIVNGEAESVIENVRFHHNYCERSVGLFEGCSGNFRGTDAIQEHHGIIRNSYVGYNIAVDAMWLYLLQPVNTDFENLVFEHNTIVHGPDNTTIPQQGASSFGLLVNDDAGYSFTLSEGDVTVRNNLFVTLDGAEAGMFSPPPLADHFNNVYVPSTPMGAELGAGEKAVAEPGLSPDHRILAGSPLIDQGSADTPVYATDIDGHPVPCGATQDVGASEYCDNMGGTTGTGGAPGNGGSDATAGAGPVGAGGLEQGSGGSAPGQGGDSPVGSGGLVNPASGGLPGSAGSDPAAGVPPVSSGGAPLTGAGGSSTAGAAAANPGAGGLEVGSGGSAVPPDGGSAPLTGSGGDAEPSSAGTAPAAAGSQPSDGPSPDDSAKVDSGDRGGDVAGCGCRTSPWPAQPSRALALWALVGVLLLWRRRWGT